MLIDFNKALLQVNDFIVLSKIVTGKEFLSRTTREIEYFLKENLDHFYEVLPVDYPKFFEIICSFL